MCMHDVCGSRSLQALRTIADPSSMESGQERDEFFQVWYEKAMPGLVSMFPEEERASGAVMSKGTSDNAIALAKHGRSTAVGYVTDLLSFCVVHHG